MEIVLYYTQEELKTLLDGLSNSIISVANVYSAAYFGCEVPTQLYPLFQNRSYEEIKEIGELRLNSLIDLYKYLKTFEE